MAKLQPIPYRVALVNPDGTPTVFGYQTLNAIVDTLVGNEASGVTSFSFGPFVLMIGTGSPAGVVSAGPGTLYINNAGGAGTTLFVKESGSGASGWVGK